MSPGLFLSRAPCAPQQTRAPKRQLGETRAPTRFQEVGGSARAPLSTRHSAAGRGGPSLRPRHGFWQNRAACVVIGTGRGPPWEQGRHWEPRSRYQVYVDFRVAEGPAAAVTRYHTALHVAHWLLGYQIDGEVLVHLEREDVDGQAGEPGHLARLRPTQTTSRPPAAATCPHRQDHVLREFIRR